MRDDRTIERDIEVAREDLEARLTELRTVIHEKLHVGKRLRERIQRPVREHPLVSVAAALGLGVLAALVRTRRRPRLAAPPYPAWVIADQRRL
jgi:MYXO-CTERM domain-containing protein